MSLGKAPSCCGKKAMFIDHGPKIQYWYCKECKKEVPSKDNSKISSEKTSEMTDDDIFALMAQSNWADAIANAQSSINALDPATKPPCPSISWF